MTRLRPWVNQAKLKVTKNPEIRAQLGRVEVVKITNQTLVVEKGDHHEFSAKPRFVYDD